MKLTSVKKSIQLDLYWNIWSQARFFTLNEMQEKANHIIRPDLIIDIRHEIWDILTLQMFSPGESNG